MYAFYEINISKFFLYDMRKISVLPGFNQGHIWFAWKSVITNSVEKRRSLC